MIELGYQLEIFQPDGKLVSDTGFQPCKSLVLQFLQLCEACFREATMTITDTGGTDRSIVMPGTASGLEWHYADAGSDADTWGIVVGTGTTAVANDDTALETKISDGNGAGELEYQETAFTAAGEVGANLDFQIRRTFLNDSGNSITVTEIGLYVKGTESGGTNRIFCVIHDIVSQAVADAETLSVKFTYRTTA